MRIQLYKSRFLLVVTGLSLGYFARFVLGPPASETAEPNRFERPLPVSQPSENEPDEIVIPLRSEANDAGLVPPILLPGQRPFFHTSYGSKNAQFANSESAFAHDSTAEFEPHGELICASGCALSRHPTEELSLSHFEQLLAEFAQQNLDDTSPALEELLYYGPQTKGRVQSDGLGTLDDQRADFLWAQLQLTHARVSIRVVDEQGEIRTWLDETRVPFDRRHVFEMQTKNLQPLVTSGTVKRVGLNHLWVRL